MRAKHILQLDTRSILYYSRVEKMDRKNMVANEGSSSQFLISNLRLNEVAMVIKKPKISPFAEILQIVDAPPLLYYCKSSRKGSC